MLTMPILFAPVEEWICRGVILRYLIRPIGAIAALLVSSAIFSLGHGLAGSPGRFIAGLAFGALYLRYHSLWPPIAAHVVNNALAVTAWVLMR